MKKIEELICQLKGISEIFGGADIMMKFQKSTDDNLGKLPTSREGLSQHRVTKLVLQSIVSMERLSIRFDSPKTTQMGMGI